MKTLSSTSLTAIVEAALDPDAAVIGEEGTANLLTRQYKSQERGLFHSGQARAP